MLCKGQRSLSQHHHACSRKTKGNRVIALNLVVLRAHEPDRPATFCSGLGMQFREEGRGNGPRHHACEIGGSVLEIYPLEPGAEGTRGTRLGFSVDKVDDAIQAIESRAGVVVSRPKMTAWCKRAVVIDPEGHRVELVEAGNQAGGSPGA